MENNVQGQHGQEKARTIALLQLINRGLPTEVWSCFHSLVQKRENHTLTAAELAELIELAESIDVAQAQRMEGLVELAVLQNKSLAVLMDELGIGTLAHESDPKN